MTDPTPQPDAAVVLTEAERDRLAALILRDCTHEGRTGKDWCCRACHDLRRRVLHPADRLAQAQVPTDAREAPSRAVIDAVLKEFPLDDLTGHVIDCGYDANDEHCGCSTLPARIAAALSSVTPDAGKREAQERAQDGVALIAAERRRQVEAEGYTPEHDDDHHPGEFVEAAIAYMSPNDGGAIWPWEREGFKPEVTLEDLRGVPGNQRHGSKRDLAKAGALIAAALDVLARADRSPEQP